MAAALVCGIYLLLAVLEGRSGSILRPTYIPQGSLIKEVSLNSLGSVLNSIRNVYSSSSRVFPYYDTALATQLEGFVPEYEYTSSFRIEDDNVHHYYSGNIMEDVFVDLRTAVNLSKEVFRLIPDSKIRNQLTANVWIGEAGVSASAHYDAVYNLYIQVSGTKRITLLPPSSVHSLQVHGRMHPYACQSRYSNITTSEMFEREPFCMSQPCPIALDGIASEVMDSLEQNTPDVEPLQSAIVHTLGPGDVLVIPPFWFHQVDTLTDAMSVSLWWDAKELDIMDEIYALPLPLEADWGATQLIQSTQRFVDALLECVVETTEQHVRTQLVLDDVVNVGNNFSVHSLQRLLRLRYKEDWIYLYRSVNSRATSADSSIHLGDNDKVTKRVRERLHAAAHRRAQIFTARFLSDDVYVRWSSLNLESMRCGTQNEEKSSGDSIGTDGYCDGNGESVSDDADTLRNQLAVLSIKVCDYIEDVFRHVAEMLSALNSEHFQSHTRGKSPRRSVNNVAVQLLLDWLNCASGK